MESIIQVATLAFLIEALVDTMKLMLLHEDSGKINKSKSMALLIGIMVAFATILDIFIVLNIQSAIPYIGVVFAGILISRGGNFVHDFLDRI